MKNNLFRKWERDFHASVLVMCSVLIITICATTFAQSTQSRPIDPSSNPADSQSSESQSESTSPVASQDKANTEDSESSIEPLPTQQTTLAEVALEDPDTWLENAKQEISQRLEQLGESDEAAKALYQSAMTKLTAAESLAKENAKWKEAAASAPKRSQIAEQEKADLSAESVPEYDLSFDEGKAELQSLEAEMSQASKQATALTNELARRTVRRKELPKEIADAKLAQKDLQAVAGASEEDFSPVLQDANRWVRDVNRILAAIALAKVENELQAYEAEATLLPLQKEVADERVLRLQRSIKLVNEVLAKTRTGRIDRYRLAMDRPEVPKTELFNRIREWLKFSDPTQADTDQDDTDELTWLTIAQKHDAIISELPQAKAEYSNWDELQTNAKAEIEPVNGESFMPGTSRWAVKKLRKQRSRLPDPRTLVARMREISRAAAPAEALQSDLDDTLDELKSLRVQQRVIADSQFPEISAQAIATEATPESIELAIEILEAMKSDVEGYLKDLYELGQIKEKMEGLVRSYRDFIDKQLLWTPSAQPIGWQTLSNVIPAARWLLSTQNWQQMVQLLLQDLALAWPFYVLFSGAFGWLLLRRPSFLAGLQKIAKKAKRKTCTDYSLTTSALLNTVWLSLPLPLILLFVAWRMNATVQRDLVEGFPLALSSGLLLATYTLFPMSVLFYVCHPHGLAVAHFDSEEKQIAVLRKGLRWLIDLSIPLIAIVGIFISQSSVREESFGRLAFILLMVLLGCFIVQTLRPRRGILNSYLLEHQGGWLDRLRYLWFGALVAIPVVLIFLSMLGYLYTAQQLASRLDKTFWMLVFLSVSFHLVKRWLVLNRRDLMMAQARQRLNDAASGSTSELPAKAVEDETFDLVEINEQTKRLVSSTFVATGLLLAFAVWSDVLPAINLLDRVELWHVMVEGDPPERVAITLANLLWVIPIAVLATIATRNVPGLLEIALLQHLPLTKAARYAITTLARYLIAGLGIYLACSAIGLRWESIQWLVAGLGVGLGFGLQEIFANFVAGIILLFEQPIRVGDIVTVDGTTGTVAKIRMRATTIVNWDRQELIVPNKDLITGKLINWTLSDTTNRVVVNVGIAYGSDSAEACRLVREVCEEHPNVLRDPAPMVTFEGFGDNTLNLVVRVFLASLDNRLSTIHELHQAIYSRLNDAKIEIAFPQRDLHLRSLPANLQNWLSGGSSNQAGRSGNGVAASNTPTSNTST